MTRDLDPDRRRPAPPHPGYDPRELDVDLDVCRWCGALVPADERQRTKHEEWDRRIVGRFRTLFDKLSEEDAPAGSPSTSPPTPEQEPRTVASGRSGAEGSNQGIEVGAAGLPPSGATPPPAAVPPAAGGANRHRSRPARATGEVAGRTGRADDDPDTEEQLGGRVR